MAYKVDIPKYSPLIKSLNFINEIKGRILLNIDLIRPLKLFRLPYICYKFSE